MSPRSRHAAARAPLGSCGLCCAAAVPATLSLPAAAAAAAAACLSSARQRSPHRPRCPSAALPLCVACDGTGPDGSGQRHREGRADALHHTLRRRGGGPGGRWGCLAAGAGGGQLEGSNGRVPSPPEEILSPCAQPPVGYPRTGKDDYARGGLEVLGRGKLFCGGWPVLQHLGLLHMPSKFLWQRCKRPRDCPCQRNGPCATAWNGRFVRVVLRARRRVLWVRQLPGCLSYHRVAPCVYVGIPFEIQQRGALIPTLRATPKWERPCRSSGNIVYRTDVLIDPRSCPTSGRNGRRGTGRKKVVKNVLEIYQTYKIVHHSIFYNLNYILL